MPASRFRTQARFNLATAINAELAELAEKTAL
jgi:hypothetical protein